MRRWTALFMLAWVLTGCGPPRPVENPEPMPSNRFPISKGAPKK